MGKKGSIKFKTEKMVQKDAKPKIDERFQAMFTDKNFKLTYVTDKRGRPMEHTSSQDLKEFYSMSSSEEDEEDITLKSDEDVNKSNIKVEQLSPLKPLPLTDKVIKKEFKTHFASSSELSDEDNSEKEEEEKTGASPDSSSETGTDVSDEEYVLDGEFDHKWEELDANAPVASDITKRLALCNMDWDRIRAEDILTVFNSFKPANGVIHSVKIYPSEFGLKRMETEKLNGPAELVEKTLDDDDKVVNKNKEGSKYHREKLRQYQLNRLKYYFAVIDCDSPETADSLYEQLNGMEYESSAVCMDLRFIPDDTTFDQEPKWVAETIPDPAEYKPRLFANSALKQVKVNLTWDETDPKRNELIQKAFHEPESIEKDIKIYLASSSSDSEDEDIEQYNKDSNREMKFQERVSKYKELLQSIEEKEKEEKNKYELEITWEPGLKDETEKKVKEKIEKESLTPFEEKLKKRKEERKIKKKEKKVLLNKDISGSDDDSDYSEANDRFGNDNDDDDRVNDFKNAKQFQEKRKPKDKMVKELSLLVDEPVRENTDEIQRLSKKKKKKLEKKRKETKADKFEVNVNDSRFSAIYTSHLYNIDPSDPHFKDSKAMQAIVKEKLKRKSNFLNEKSPRKEPKRLKQLHDIENDSQIDDSVILI